MEGDSGSDNGPKWPRVNLKKKQKNYKVRFLLWSKQKP